MFFEQKNTEYDQEKKNFQFWVGYSETQGNQSEMFPKDSKT